jgi:ADP-ribose pyrophosphatase
MVCESDPSGISATPVADLAGVTRMTEPNVTTRTVFQGKIFRVDVDRVRLPNGRDIDFEILRHPGSVVLLPMPAPDQVLLVRQYRYAIDRFIWELAAGRIDPGEDAETAAQRECHEELGLVADQIEHLGAFYPTPGYCDEVMIFYRMTGLKKPDTEAALDEDEQIEPRAFTLDEARRLVDEGTVIDLKTIVGLTLLSRQA